MIRRNSLVVRVAIWGEPVDDRAIDHEANIMISHSHTPTSRIVIERADRWDLLIALMEAQGVDPDIIKLVDPTQPKPPRSSP